jgi:hypothetical protein
MGLSQIDDATLKDLRKVVSNIRQTIMWSYEVWSWGGCTNSHELLEDGA